MKLPRGRIFVIGVILGPILLFAAGYALVEKIDGDSLNFFRTGKSIVEMLGSMGDRLEAREFGRLQEFYADNYEGSRLGLVSSEKVKSPDGIDFSKFVTDGASLSGEQATEEWKTYLNQFQSIEEAGLHLHRLDSWGSSNNLAAVVRFELIGVLEGSTQRSIDRAYFDAVLAQEGDRLKIKSFSLNEGERIASKELHFENVAAEAGVAFKNEYYPAFLNEPLEFAMIRYGPGGVTAVDYDNDGFHDLYIPDGEESKFFRNMGDGTFRDITEESGLSGQDGVSVATFTDFDNDGYKDAFISRTFQPNQLFRNNGDGTFTNVTKKSGIGADCCTTVASWADYDLDGYVDLYVGRYLDPRLHIPTTFYARNAEPNQLYHNNGDGTFTNVTEEAGVGELGLCLGTVFGDYNDDIYPDLYAVNDFGRNTLYRNNGNGTFTDVTVETNTLAYGAGMNATMGDYDHDGKLDIYVTNIRSEHAWFAEPPTVFRYMMNSFRQGVWAMDMPLYWEIFRQSGFAFTGVFKQMASGNTLLRNRGDGTFEDTTWAAGANPIGWFWGASMTDFDNDGWQDIYAANGWVYNDPDTEIELDFLNNVVSRQDEYKTGVFFDPEHFGTTSWHGWERNRMLRNKGDGTFDEVGTATGTDLLLNSRGVAAADYWNRGVVDLAIAACDDRHALLKNQHVNDKNWLQVELVGTESNRDAVGARVVIRVNGKIQMREVVVGDSYGSQSSLRLHFGLDNADVVEEMTVRWPRLGSSQTFRNIPVNRIVQATEGNSELIEKNYQVDES